MRYLFIKIISLSVVTQALWCKSNAQPNNNESVFNKIVSIEQDTSMNITKKLDLLYTLKQDFETNKLTRDSVYARMLHRIAAYDYAINNFVPTDKSINLTHIAAIINSSGKKSSSSYFLVNNYSNLGLFYKTLGLYNLARIYFDSAVIIRKKLTTHSLDLLTLMIENASMLKKIGDFDKSIDQLNEAIPIANHTNKYMLIPTLLNQRAQANLKRGNLNQKFLNEALHDVEEAGDLAKRNNNTWEAINSMVIKADILGKKNEFKKGLTLYQQAIPLRIQAKNYNQISDDYTDMGNFYLSQGKNNYKDAGNCYMNTVMYAEKTGNAERLAKGHVNLGIVSFLKKNYSDAEKNYIRAFEDLKIKSGNNILNNPAAADFNIIGNKELVLVILGNKLELLQQKYNLTNNKNVLAACLQTALLADTLITNARHEQVGEQSKLYWRDWTREFFTSAIEACYIASDTKLALYFMEKSRAVLLNDKLNELSASSQLPYEEAQKEKDLKIELISAQQKAAATVNTPEFEKQLSNVLQAQNNLEHYIKSLEKKYPAYYQYKYSDNDVTLSGLQKYLLKHQQSFIHYFMNDTAVYILAITPDSSAIIKFAGKDFDYRKIEKFNYLCNNRNAIRYDSDYQLFAYLSNNLYQTLFQPLHLPEGRIIICPDNFMLSFEALCSDNNGKRFLMNDYTFSYVYSARYLLNKVEPSFARGTFVGFAPVSFNPDLMVPDLKQSAVFLRKVAGYYKDFKLFTNSQATKKNFINYIFNYKIVNVFSHGKADTSNNEPLLYMQDSVIRLSELHVLDRPSTNLVILSACQTNVGKNETGEGIYSLARGFASVGIPSVAATLWEADEQSIYTISELFHKHLSEGMTKDSALKKAKLKFIEMNSSNEKALPFYWAGIVIIGNTDRIEPTANSPEWSVWAIAGALSLIGVIFIFVKKKK